MSWMGLAVMARGAIDPEVPMARSGRGRGIVKISSTEFALMLRLNIASNSPTLNALSRPERRRETAAERLGDDGDQPVGVGLGVDAESPSAAGY